MHPCSVGVGRRVGYIYIEHVCVFCKKGWVTQTEAKYPVIPSLKLFCRIYPVLAINAVP